MAFSVERIDRGPVLPEGSVRLPFPFHILDKNIVKLIFQNLDVVTWNRLRVVSKWFRGYVDDVLLQKSKFRDLFQQINCTGLPIILGASSNKVLTSSDERVVVKADGRILAIDRKSLETQVLCENIPDEAYYLCSQDEYHFYYNEKSLVMIDSSFQRYEFHYVQESLVEINGKNLSNLDEALQKFRMDCCKPYKAYKTKSDVVVCVTRGGTVIKWHMKNPQPFETKELSDEPISKFRKELSWSHTRTGERRVNYPSLQYLPKVESVLNEKMIILTRDSDREEECGIYAFDLETFTFLFKIHNSNYIEEIKVYDENVFVISKLVQYRHGRKVSYHLDKYKYCNHAIVNHISKELPNHSDEFGFKIRGLVDNCLIIRDRSGFRILDLVAFNFISKFEFKNLPTDPICWHGNHKFFIIDHTMIMINELRMEMSLFSIPSLNCVCTIKLNEVAEDFTYLAYEGPIYIHDNIETHNKVYPKNTVKISNVIFRNGEILISYEFKKPGTESTVGKLLNIKVGNENSYVPPKPEPKIQVVEKKFPIRKVALIGAGAAISLITTIVFACLTFAPNSTSIHKSILGKCFMSVSALSFVSYSVGGIVFAIKNKPRRKSREELLNEATTRKVRLKHGLFESFLLQEQIK